MNDFPDYYVLLGLNKSDSAERITQQLNLEERRLQSRYTGSQAEIDRMTLIQNARQFFASDQGKELYDRKLAESQRDPAEVERERREAERRKREAEQRQREAAARQHAQQQATEELRQNVGKARDYLRRGDVPQARYALRTTIGQVQSAGGITKFDSNVILEVETCLIDCGMLREAEDFARALKMARDDDPMPCYLLALIYDNQYRQARQEEDYATATTKRNYARRQLKETIRKDETPKRVWVKKANGMLAKMDLDEYDSRCPREYMEYTDEGVRNNLNASLDSIQRMAEDSDDAKNLVARIDGRRQRISQNASQGFYLYARDAYAIVYKPSENDMIDEDNRKDYKKKLTDVKAILDTALSFDENNSDARQLLQSVNSRISEVDNYKLPMKMKLFIGAVVVGVIVFAGPIMNILGGVASLLRGPSGGFIVLLIIGGIIWYKVRK